MKMKKDKTISLSKKNLPNKKHVHLKLTPESIPLTIIGRRDDLLKALTYYQNKRVFFYEDVASSFFNKLNPIKEDKRRSSTFKQNNIKIELFIINSFLKYWLKSSNNNRPKILSQIAKDDSLMQTLKGRPKLHSYTVLLTRLAFSFFAEDVKPLKEYLSRLEDGEESNVINKYIAEGKSLYRQGTAALDAVSYYSVHFQNAIKLLEEAGGKLGTLNRNAMLFFYKINTALLWHLLGMTEDIRQRLPGTRLLSTPQVCEPQDFDDSTIWEYYQIAKTIFPLKK
jgi:hypothetical protein